MATIELSGLLAADPVTIESQKGPTIGGKHVIETLIEAFGASIEFDDFKVVNLEGALITWRRATTTEYFDVCWGYAQTGDKAWGPLAPSSAPEFRFETREADAKHQHVDMLDCFAAADGEHVVLSVRTLDK